MSIDQKVSTVMEVAGRTASPIEDVYRAMNAKRSLLQSEIDLVNEKLRHYIDKRQNFQLSASDVQTVDELYLLRERFQQEIRDLVPSTLKNVGQLMQNPSFVLESAPSINSYTPPSSSSSTASQPTKEMPTQTTVDMTLLNHPQAPRSTLELLAQLGDDLNLCSANLHELHQLQEKVVQETVMPTPDIVQKLNSRIRRLYEQTATVHQRHLMHNYPAKMRVQLDMLDLVRSSSTKRKVSSNTQKTINK